MRAEFARGVLRTLLVMATGCGKTVCFAELGRWVVSLAKRVLVLAHRSELLEQAQRKLSDVDVWAAIEQADRRAGLAPVVVASVQTLQRARLEALDPAQFGLVVVDEGHHAPAASYRNILERFSAVPTLLVTATPDRADGKALGEICQSVAYRYEMRDAIRDKWLAPLRVRRIELAGVDLSRVKTRAGDLASDELGAIMAEEHAVLGTAIPLLEQAGNRRTIVFAVNVEHAYALAKALCDRRGGCARVAHGEMDAHERAEVLADFRAGAFQFLVNVALFTEGFDEPSVSCVAVARPTKSRALYTQMVGRGTRLLGASLEESIANGKRDCLVLDFVGNSGRHKLVGPLDALAAGTPIDDELRGEAERILAEEEHDADDVLDEAARRLEERRKAIRQSATAEYFARDVDPFFGDELGEPITAPWAMEIASEQQRAALAVMGMKRVPAAITRGEAVRILNADIARRRAGLATYKQCRLLATRGVDGKRMTRTQASAVLTKLGFDRR